MYLCHVYIHRILLINTSELFYKKILPHLFSYVHDTYIKDHNTFILAPIESETLMVIELLL